MSNAKAAFEAYKKRKNDSNKSSQSNTKSKAQEAFESYQNRKNPPVVVDKNYIESFVNDASSFLSSAEKEYGSMNWSNSSSAFDKVNSTWNDLNKRADVIKSWLDRNKNGIDGETYNTLSSSVNAFQIDGSSVFDSFKNKSELFSQFTSEDEYNTWYADWKKKEDEKQAVLSAEDFEEYYNAGAGVTNPTWEDSQAPVNLFGWTPFGEGKTIGNMVTFAEENKGKAITEAAQAVRGGGSSGELAQLVNLINEYMTDEEKSIYNYYIGKGETQKAEQYLNSLKDTFVQRQGGKIAENVKGDRLGEVFFAAAAGLDQFVSGIGNIDNLITGAEADPLSAIQYANPLVREDMNGGWGIAYDLMSTTANMFPSILVGTVTGGAGSLVTLGASAAGNGYAEMRRLGYDEWQSRGYGVLVGVAEAVLQKFLGGISKIGGGGNGIFQTVVSKIVPKLDNAIARTAITLGGNMLDEGLEEAIQEVLNPIIKMAATGEDFEGVNIEDVLYSGLLGALSAGMLEGVPSVAGTAIQSHNASKVYGADANALVAESLEIDPNNTHAQRMQERLNKGENVSGYQLNRLVEANESALKDQDTAKMKSAVEARLTALGETEGVSELADIIVKAQSGGKLTPSERSTLVNSKYGRRVSTELNPQSIESGEYSSAWAENIGTERINAEAYNKNIQGTIVDETSAPVATKSVPTTKNTPAKESVTEGKFEASKDVVHTIERDGEKVKTKVARIASIGNGNMTVELDDGSVVDAGSVNYGGGAGLLYQAASDMASRVGGFNVDTANVFVNGFNHNGNITVGEYVHGFSDAYRYGAMGYPVSELENGANTSKLTDVQRNMAYNFGKAFGNEKVAKKQEKIASTVATSADKNAQNASKGKKGKVHFDGVAYGKNLNERQKASVKALEVAADALGIDIYLFESEVDENGKRLGENGSYDPETNSIRIDLYAGRDGNSLMLFTAAHELTHHIREVSPAKFKVFADFLLAEYGKRGVSVEQLIQKKMDVLRKHGRLEGMTEEQAYDLAYEEVIADSCEAMLVDSNAIEKLAELKEKDKGLWQTIKDFITKLVARIKKAYEGLSPDSAEGKQVRKMLDAAEKLQSLWVDALMDASEQFSTDNIRGNADGAVAQNDVTKAVADIASNEGELLSIRTEYEVMPKQVMNLTNGAGTLLHSIEGLTPKEVPGLTTKGINGFTGRDVRAYAMGVSGFASAQIKRVNTFMDAMGDFMKEAGVTYKFIGLQDVENAKLHYSYNPDGSIKSIVLSAMVKNGDYPVNFDLSSICKKRVAMSALIDKLAKRGSLDNGTVKLTPANIFRINTALKDAGYETACLGCFVESKRYNSLEWANTFCNKWNAAVKKVNPNATYFGYGDASFNEDSFTLEQAVKIDKAANQYVKSTKVERMTNALEKYRVKERAGQPLVEGKIMKVDGEELNTFSKAARDRLMKSDTISEELKTKYLTCDVSTLTIDDVEFLLENGVLPGASLSNKQAVTEMVKSGEAYQHLLRPSDLLTDRGISKLEALPNFHGVLYGHYGSGTPKLMQSYTPYNSEIALLPANKSDQTLAEYLYTIAGVRMQSFSDFQIQNIYDYLQMVADLAARKLPAHAYTKEISFAKLLGMTGIKVNLSVMFDIDPLVDKDHAGLTKLNKLIHRGEYAKVVLEDAQGQWVYNIGDYQTQRMFAEAYPDEAKRFLQSIGFGDAVKLQSSQGYSANCGIIGVGYSDLGIFAMLDDNRIRYIIPYHASSLPSEIKVATHIDRGTDYTPYQNNMKIDGIVDRNGNAVNWTIKEAYKRLGSGQAVINELNDKVRNEGWVVTTKKAQTGHGTYGLYEDLQQTNDPRQTAGNFMDWCIKNSTLPLFYQFASHNNYYKLLYDFNVYDCVTEEYAPQQAVTNTYPTMVDGQVQPGNVTDGNFDTEYLQGTIDKQMAFMDEYGRNLDEDLEKLSDNMEEGNYSLNKKGLVNGKLLLSDRDSYAPTFYSHMGKVIDGIRLEKMGAGGVVSYLKGKGVKNEEIKWSGIEAFLEGKKSVTKAELQEFVAGSQLQIEEEMSGRDIELRYDHSTDSYTVFDGNGDVIDTYSYNSDLGGYTSENDDEVYEYASDLEKEMRWVHGSDNAPRHAQYKLEGGTNYREIVFKMPNSTYSNNAMRAHWGQDAEGVLAHARIQDFTTDYGKKMLFIEELQSDWHNEGLQKGYSTKEYEDAKAVYDKLAEDYANKRRAFNKYVRSSEFRSDPDDVSKKKFDWLRSKMETAEKRMQDAERDLEALNQKGMGDVPDAPFRSTYHEYVLKRLLRMAAEEGYDSIGWTTAETQSNRWSNEYAEAYRIEYDQEMPKFLRKYGKKWGVEVDYENLNGEVVWSMPIPSSMKDSALHEGQVLFSDRYQSADTNSDILSLIEKVGNGNFRANEKVELGTVSDSTATEIQNITGINVKGFKVAIEARQIEHILKDHGENGTTDRSMANPRDIAKMEFALRDYDDISPAGKTQAYSHMVNGRNRTADTVLYEKEIGEKSYYVVQAVPDTKAKTLYVVTAFIGKKGYKKEASQLINAKRPDATAKTGSVDTSGRIISQPDDFVKRDDEKFSERDPDNFSNRSLLSDALDTVAQNDIEREKLKQYKQKIDLINAEEKKLRTLRAQIKELYSQTGPRGSEEIRNLQFEANQAANRINTYDRQLLTLESTKALKGVLEREKEMVRKRVEKEAAQRRKDDLAKAKERAARTERELMNRYQESRKKATESRHKTEMRHKIQNVVNELNQYLLKGTKDKHVPIELQKAVAEALDAVNMDTVGAEERLAEIHNKLQKENDPFKIEQLLESYRRISEMGERMDGKLQRLKAAYDDIVNSNDPLIANSHDEVISNSIANVISEVGSTPLRDMTLSQLESVYDMYKMVLTTIRNTNKAFKAAKSEEISTIANGVIAELDAMRKDPKVVKGLGVVSEFGWNNLKPVYAFDRIGSANFTKVFNAVRAGEDVWAKDMSEAKQFLEEQKEKHGYKSFDFDKGYDFESSTGLKFTLRLDQIMSLYAYSKRGQQAKDHLKYGGFQFDGTTEIKEKNGKAVKLTYLLKDTTTYQISDELLAKIVGVLDSVKGAKAFVDEMQEYLSSTMGEKGNEVSLALYDVKLFKEKNYFPLKVSHDFLAKKREQAQAEVKIKNSGFTKETNPNAKNPIVLSSFMDVWAGHVNEMSMYHAFTLPLEDFYRVYNYGTPNVEGQNPISVVSSLRGAHRDASVQYIDQLLKDLNGGARSDPRETFGKKMISMHKKASVMASLSVVIQQPSAIVRATALVDAKHFVGKKPSKGKHKEVWEEVKKYAPIAVIKEMGYFDTGMGKSSVEWLKGEKTFMDKVDDFTSKAPAYADEMAWIAIWNAVKRETLRNNKNLKANSEEFFKVVGERFTEVIVKTQVYDSTLARSANMRSKSALMSMWTAFMAEPTTSINMLQNALTQRKRGDKKILGKAIKAVYGSVLLNSALVSLVYAMRDDDEDETFLEKYLSRLTTEVIDGINPITYIPFFKDIWSLAQGFDVERADMSLINDVVDSFQQMVKLVGKDTSDMDEDERSEHKKAIASAILGVTDSLSSLFGVPVKNVRRDLNGIINAFNTAKTDLTERDTSLGSLADNVIEDVKNSVPVWGWLPDEQKSSKLYDAIINGDKEYLDRLKGSYKSDTAYQSAIRKALRDNDPRIKEAAEARFNGNTSEYMRIAKKIIAEGNFSQDDIVAAINSEVNALAKDEVGIDTSTEGDKVESIFEASDFFSAIQKGDIVTAYTVKEDIINAYTENGKDRDEAEAEFNSDFASHIKKQYEEGDLTASKAKNMLVEYGGKTTEEANSKVQYWEFKKKYPEYDFSESAVTKFYEEIEPAGISISVYADYVKKAAKCEGTDKNGDGKTDSGSKKAEVLKVINSLPISSKQKDALYFAEGWAASTLYEAPWH